MNALLKPSFAATPFRAQSPALKHVSACNRLTVIRTSALAPARKQVQQAAVAQNSEQKQQAPTQPTQLASALSSAAIISLAVAGSASAADFNVVAQTAEGVEAIQLAINILRPLFAIFTLLYIVRIPMTWYPNIDFSKFPWAIAYAPTEPFLAVTRKVVPLLNGVDISPIVLTGVISFLNEILLGPQGILTLLEREGGF